MAAQLVAETSEALNVYCCSDESTQSSGGANLFSSSISSAESRNAKILERLPINNKQKIQGA